MRMQALRELRELVERHVGKGTFATADRDELGVKLVAVRAAQTQLVHQVYERVFGIVVHGEKRIELGDQRFSCRAGSLLISAVELPVAIQITHASREQPFLALAMNLRPKQVATLLLEAGSAERASDEDAAMRVSAASADIVDAFVRLLQLADRPSDVAIMQPMIEREIVWRLLCGEQGALVRQIGLADSRLSKIGHAIRWIRENYASSFRIEDLAKRAAMSPTSFHRHFRAATAMSPLQYQKQIRLQIARTRLVSKSEDIASVGFSVGYDSPSQFTREYARLFGAPPSRDTFHDSRAAAVT